MQLLRAAVISAKARAPSLVPYVLHSRCTTCARHPNKTHHRGHMATLEEEYFKWFEYRLDCSMWLHINTLMLCTLSSGSFFILRICRHRHRHRHRRRHACSPHKLESVVSFVTYRFESYSTNHFHPSLSPGAMVSLSYLIICLLQMYFHKDVTSAPT